MAVGLHLSVLKPLVGTHPKHSHIKSEYALIPLLAFCSSVHFCPRPWSFLQTAKGFYFLWVFFPALFSFSSLSGHISPRACPAPAPSPAPLTRRESPRRPSARSPRGSARSCGNSRGRGRAQVAPPALAEGGGPGRLRLRFLFRFPSRSKRCPVPARPQARPATASCPSGGIARRQWLVPGGGIGEPLSYHLMFPCAPRGRPPASYEFKHYLNQTSADTRVEFRTTM